MFDTLSIALLSALIVSTVSFIGAATFFFNDNILKKVMNLLLALAAGAMMGNALLHMLPHALEQAEHAERPAIVQTQGQSQAPAQHVHQHGSHSHHDHDHDHDAEAAPAAEHDHDHDHDAVKDEAPGGQTSQKAEAHEHSHHGLSVMAIMLLGFFVLFGLDLTLLSIGRNDDEGVKPLGYLVLFSDGMENFMDGLVIGAAYLVSIPVGISATIAIFLHEVPMELGDFAVLRHSGFSRSKALFLNFLSACVSLVGVALAVVLGTTFSGFVAFATPFAAGAILYLAASGLLPQLRKQGNGKEKVAYFFMTVLGVAAMAAILLLE